MSNLKQFILSAGILTSTSLFMQLVGVIFNVYISGKIGAEGMGTLQLIMSVYRLATTFSLTGIGLTATRLVAEELAMHRESGVKKAVSRCLAYSFCFGTVAAASLICGNEFISNRLLGDPKTAGAICAMGVSMPFISASCVLDGYFTAIRRVAKSAFSRITEQFLRMIFVIYLVRLIASSGTGSACLAVTAGGSAAEILSFFIMYSFYLSDSRKYTNSSASPKLTSKMLRIALPVGIGSYLRSGLVSAQQLLIPTGLSKYGGTRSGALAKYGIVQGMVMPVIMFPSSFLIAFSSLTIPELARLRQKGQNGRISYIVSNVFKATLIFSVCMSGIMLSLADEIAITVYKNSDAAIFIRLLAPLATAMYLDNSVDGMLKGLDRQLSSMHYNIADGIISLLLVCTIVPKFGIHGYIIVIFVSELFNMSLSAAGLIKTADFKISITDWILKPMIAITAAVFVLRAFTAPTAGYVNLLLYIIFIITIYLILLRLMGVKIKPEEP